MNPDTSDLHLRATTEGVELSVKVVPGASRSRVLGVWQGALRVAVAAPPQGGRANREVQTLLAEVLGLRRSSVRIISGATRPLKRICLVGATPGAVREALNAL